MQRFFLYSWLIIDLILCGLFFSYIEVCFWQLINNGSHLFDLCFMARPWCNNVIHHICCLMSVNRLLCRLEVVCPLVCVGLKQGCRSYSPCGLCGFGMTVIFINEKFPYSCVFLVNKLWMVSKSTFCCLHESKEWFARPLPLCLQRVLHTDCTAAALWCNS